MPGGGKIHRIFLLALVGMIAPVAALAQECQTCWADSCKEMRAYGVPACAPASTPTAAATPREAAESCPAGQSRTDDTAGHCCWPGQGWSRSKGRCIGAPDCPSGLTARDETCKAVAVPARTATPVGPPKAGDIRRDSKTGLSYAFLPGGTFLMGCASGDSRCFDNESAHNQAVDALWMNVTDVTVAAYTRCVEAGSCTAAKTDFASCNYGRRPNHPINCVSWEQASSFCGWAGGRLPTAAEWEYAAKNGRDVVYPWGNEPVNGRRTNYCDVNCAKEIPADLVEQWKKDGWLDASQDDGWSATSPVGSYPAGDTPWGLKDMAGNAVQWTASHFDANNIEVRGGSWGSNAPALRSSFREKIAPDGGSYTVGFRCVQ